MKKQITITCLIIFCCLSAFSQSYPEQLDPVPPSPVPASPTVAELGKYGEIPVSHYTGIPNINIPLYTLQCGKLSLPISLSYHAGGIRVDQIASWVGLGWSLNAAGIISRSVMGISDDKQQVTLPHFDIDSYSSFTYPSYQDINAILNRQYDSQPDIYSYNFMSYSGQFVQGSNGDIYDLKDNKQIKIDIQGQYASEFVVRDMSGNSYEFTYRERTTRRNYYGSQSFEAQGGGMMSDGGTDEEYTAWLLTSITSADGVDKIVFSYDYETQKYNTPMQGKITYDVIRNKWFGSGEGGNGLNISSPFYYSEVETQTYRLQQIHAQSNNKTIARIDFVESVSERTDLEGSKRLEKITVVGANNNVVKQWNFNYDYFISYIQTDFFNSRRLKLKSIEEDGEKLYRFVYYGDSTGDPQLPYRTAFCGYDYWGYANGIVTATEASDIKKLFSNSFSLEFTGTRTTKGCAGNYTDPGRTETRTVSFSAGSNKEPNIKFATAYTIKELHYPTKGSTKFEYELHDYNVHKKIGNYWHFDSIKQCGGLRIKSIINSDNGVIKEKKTYSYNLYDEWDNIDTGESSSSLISPFIPYSKKISKSFKDNVTTIQDVLELSSTSYSSMYSYGGDYIGYSEVTESTENGSKRYKFWSISDFPNAYRSIYAYAWFTDNTKPIKLDIGKSYSTVVSGYAEPFRSGHWGKSYGRGLMKSIETFDKLDRIVYDEFYNYYEPVDLHKIYGMEVVRDQYDYLVDDCPPSSSGATFYNTGYGYYLNAYYHQTGRMLLQSKSTNRYTEPGSEEGINTYEEYKYNAYNQITEVKTTRSDRRTETIIYKHPSEITNEPFMSVMKGIYNIAPVIRTEKRIDDKIVYADYKKYSHLSGPDAIFQLKTASPINSNQDYSGQMEEKIRYNKYNQYGRVTSAISNDNLPIIYLWSYYSQYPIAEIKNATYEQVCNALSGGENYINQLADRASPLPDDVNKITGLRNSLPQAYITTYTYEPLVGMINATDPRGITTYYDYDNSGRLKETYIYENGVKKTLQEYNYSYR